jgi:Protein of unknown function (DUF4242)
LLLSRPAAKRPELKACGSPRSTGGGRRATVRSMLFLAEFYLPVNAPLADIAQQARQAAAAMSVKGAQIRFVQAIFIAQDETCFALFEAPTAAVVSAAAATAGLEFDRITAAMAAW